MRPYPTREGIPIPVEEVGLRASQLNPRKEHNYNNHHHYWARASYEKTPIHQTLRGLERSQTMMLKDQHNMGKTALHTIFAPPKVPTLKRAMEEIEEAYTLEERLKIQISNGRYVLRRMSPEYFERLKNHYDKMK